MIIIHTYAAIPTYCTTALRYYATRHTIMIIILTITLNIFLTFANINET